MASGSVPIDSAWAQEAIRRSGEGQDAANIAVAVGKNAASVRKVLKAAREQGLLPADPIVESNLGNGNGNGHAIPGQTTVDDHLADFKAEAGEAVGPMPPREPEDALDDPEPRLKGTRQLALDFGPNADIPVGGTLVIKSDKLASGFFGLGDVIEGTFTARIVDVGGKERLQRASEEFRAQPQAHVALITDLRVT